MRSIEYPYKDLLIRDDCEGLCKLVVRHERNQKEVTAVLEALGALLENSRDNCLLVAKERTLPTLATILSRYGPNDHRLCKCACVIIQRLALSQEREVEKRLRVTSSVDMVLNCMRWHAADLPVMQIGAYTLDALCSLSYDLRNIFVAQGGANAALRALARAAKSFNRDVLVASVALQVLNITAKDHGHALLVDDLLADMFRHCDMFKHERIDEFFVAVVHTLLRGMSEARDKMVTVPKCFVVFSSILDRTRGSSNWIRLFRYTSEIVSDLCRGSMRADTTSAVLEGQIVEAIIESLNKLCERDPLSQTRSTVASSHSNNHDDPMSSSNIADSSADVGHTNQGNYIGNNNSRDPAVEMAEVSAAVAGLMALLQLCELGADVLGSIHMCNCFEMARGLVKRAPNNHAIAYHVALLLISMLMKKNGPSIISDKDLVYEMLVEMKEKWRHDTIVVEKVSQAMQLIHPAQDNSNQNNHRNHHYGNHSHAPSAGGIGGSKMRKKNHHHHHNGVDQHQQQQQHPGLHNHQQPPTTQLTPIGSGRGDNNQDGAKMKNKADKQSVKEKSGWLWRRKGRGK